MKIKSNNIHIIRKTKLPQSNNRLFVRTNIQKVFETSKKNNVFVLFHPNFHFSWTLWSKNFFSLEIPKRIINIFFSILKQTNVCSENPIPALSMAQKIKLPYILCNTLHINKSLRKKPLNASLQFFPRCFIENLIYFFNNCMRRRFPAARKSRDI